MNMLDIEIPEKIRKRGEKSRIRERLKQGVLDRFEAGKQVEIALSRENPSLQEIEEAKEKGILLDFHLEKGVIISGLKLMELRYEKPGIFMTLELKGITYNLSCYKDSGLGKRGNGHLIRKRL